MQRKLNSLQCQKTHRIITFDLRRGLNRQNGGQRHLENTLMGLNHSKLQGILHFFFFWSLVKVVLSYSRKISRLSQLSFYKKFNTTYNRIFAPWFKGRRIGSHRGVTRGPEGWTKRESQKGELKGGDP